MLDEADQLYSCVPNFCLNGGRCVGDNSCDCSLTGYSGSYCELGLARAPAGIMCLIGVQTRV